MGLLSDMLSSGLDLLDKPRQAVFGLGDMVYHGFGGDAGTHLEHGSDVMGLMGMDKEGLPAQALGMGLDMVADPMTYAGGWLGAKAGGALFGKLGSRLGADASKLALEVPEEMAGRQGVGILQDALKSPHASDILHEIPPGSTFHGAGAESVAMKTPQGDVLKLSPFDAKSAVGYPDVPQLNAPTRRQVFGKFEVSRSPLATNVGDEALFNQHAPGLETGLFDHGVTLADAMKPEDLGLVNGQPKLLDMGSIDTTLPFQPVRGATPGKYKYPSIGILAALGASHNAA